MFFASKPYPLPIVQPLSAGSENRNDGRMKFVSIAIFAWNEEEAIAATLTSLFGQSLFAELNQRQLSCEVICVINGCTDRTPDIAGEVFGEVNRLHLHRQAIRARVENLKERGKLNAWNQFVHHLSAREAEYLFMMDADILIHRKDTMRNMLRTLENNPSASVAVDRPCKDIEFKWHKTLRERLSLAVSRVTQSARAQLCGQLYCIRSKVARNIYLPRDLAACEDGFIKSLVCTDFLTHAVEHERICLAEQAEHTFEAYTGFNAILKNQKRQIIGQTLVHILVDKYLSALRLSEKLQRAEVLKKKDQTDPTWLKQLLHEHLQRTRVFWKLYPGLLVQRFRTLKQFSRLRRLAHLPAAVAGFLVSLFPCYLAYATLKQGSTDYWPQARRSGLKQLAAQPSTGWEITPTHNSQEYLCKAPSPQKSVASSSV